MLKDETFFKPKMLTIRAAADEFGLPVFAVRNWVKQGKLPAVFAGRKALINAETLADYLRGQSHAESDT